MEVTLGSDYSLRDVTELCKRVGRPDRKIKVIHIAGTNGKGSVGTYLANILMESGYRVGRYLSPTILDYRERIQKIERKEKANTADINCEERKANTTDINCEEKKSCLAGTNAKHFCKRGRGRRLSDRT